MAIPKVGMLHKTIDKYANIDLQQQQQEMARNQQALAVYKKLTLETFSFLAALPLTTSV